MKDKQFDLFGKWSEYHQEVQDENDFIARAVERITDIKDCLNELYEFRFNEITGRVEYKSVEGDSFENLTARHLNSIYLVLLELNNKTTVAEIRTILNSEFVPSYHPFKAYFEGLPKWDGVDYISELADTVKTTNDAFWHNCFAKWIVALVAGATNPDIVNHTCLVFTGSQGIGKTTWALRLRPNDLDWRYFYSGYVNPESKDSQTIISECILVNLDELEALTKKQLDSLKELITKPNVSYRRPYAEFAETMSRHASYIGSVNSKQFLSDTTGSRRWLCVEVEKIDKDHKVDMDGVYSQAYRLLQEGFKYWFDLDDIKAIHENNEKFQIIKVEEELLLKYFEPCEKEEAEVILTASGIAKHIIDNERGGLTLSNSFVQSIGRSLAKNQFRRVKYNGNWAYALRNR